MFLSFARMFRMLLGRLCLVLIMSKMGQLTKKCSTVAFTSQVGQVLWKFVPLLKLCVIRVWPTRNLESFFCSVLFSLSVQTVVSLLIFRRKRSRTFVHSNSHVEWIRFLNHNFRSWHGIALCKVLLVWPRFARLSARSFPGIPTWAGIHMMIVLLVMCCWIAWIQGWVGFELLSAFTQLWESVKMSFGIVGVVLTTSRIAAASAENTEHWSGSLRWLSLLSRTAPTPTPDDDLDPSV